MFSGIDSDSSLKGNHFQVWRNGFRFSGFSVEEAELVGVAQSLTALPASEPPPRGRRGFDSPSG